MFNVPLDTLYVNRIVSDVSQLSLHSAVLQRRCADSCPHQSAVVTKDPHMLPQCCAILGAAGGSHLRMQFISDGSST